MIVKSRKGIIRESKRLHDSYKFLLVCSYGLCMLSMIYPRLTAIAVFLGLLSLKEQNSYRYFAQKYNILWVKK